MQRQTLSHFLKNLKMVTSKLDRCVMVKTSSQLVNTRILLASNQLITRPSLINGALLVLKSIQTPVFELMRLIKKKVTKL